MEVKGQWSTQTGDYQRWERNQVENTCEYMSGLFQVSVLHFESYFFKYLYFLLPTLD